MTVPAYPHLPTVALCRTGQPLSSLQIAHPCLESANWLNYMALGGVRAHVLRPAGSVNDTGTGYLYTHRHPNSRYVSLVLYVVDTAGEGGCSITATAGTGASVTWAPSGATRGTWIAFRLAWGASDSGICPITIAFSTVLIEQTILMDHPRTDYDGDDSPIIFQDAAYPAIGLHYDHAVAVSSSSGPSGLSAEIAAAWTRHRRQCYGVWMDDGDAFSWTSTGYTTLWNGLRVRARQKRSTDTTASMVIAVRSKISAAGTYTIQAVSSVAGDSQTVALTNTSYALSTALTLDVSCTEDDFVTISAKNADTGKTGKIQSLSIIEE